jgi:hypothetical protein
MIKVTGAIGCQSVADMMDAIVAPADERSIASMRRFMPGATVEFEHKVGLA